MSTRALRLLTAALLVAVAVVTAPAAVARPLAGGWSPIKDVRERYIQVLGRWAVAEYVRQGNDRRLVSGEVTGGELQMPGFGINYKLFLNAMDTNGTVALYRAFVYDVASGNIRELKSFEPAESD